MYQYIKGLFVGNLVEQRVMAAIKSKIKDADTNLKLTHQEIEDKATHDKELATEEAVQTLLAKFI